MNAKERQEEISRLRNLATVLYSENANLRGELAALKEANRWVSVEDRLPEHGVNCLVVDGNGVWYAHLEMTGRGESWIEQDWILSGVTKWRPMPEAE